MNQIVVLNVNSKSHCIGVGVGGVCVGGCGAWAGGGGKVNILKIHSMLLTSLRKCVHICCVPVNPLVE